MPARPFALTVITNASVETEQVQELRAAAGSSSQASRPLELAWPRTCSRCRTSRCLFRPTIRCTDTCRERDAAHVQLGRVQMHGENGVLAIADWVLTRQRSNPFHSYMIERIDGFVGPASRSRRLPGKRCAMHGKTSERPEGSGRPPAGRPAGCCLPRCRCSRTARPRRGSTESRRLTRFLRPTRRSSTRSSCSGSATSPGSPACSSCRTTHWHSPIAPAPRRRPSAASTCSTTSGTPISPASCWRRSCCVRRSGA